jgi:hypothetical protein
LPNEPKLIFRSIDASNRLTLRDENPDIEVAPARTPAHVDHAVDFLAMRYLRTALFRNDDPWAESETSQTSEGFLIRRTDAHEWEAQRVARNSVALDIPGDWEPVAHWLATAIEEAWLRRSR